MSVAPDVTIENVPSKANYVAPKAAGMAGASAKAKVGGAIFGLVFTAAVIAIPVATMTSDAATTTTIATTVG